MLNPDFLLTDFCPQVVALGYGFLIPLGIAAGKWIYDKAKGNKKGGGGEADEEAVQPFLSQLESSSKGLRDQGDQLDLQGSQAIAPAMDYLRQILSSNPAALMSATAPERGRVIDQYDTARRAIGEFGPRGGGTTSTLAQSRISEANALGDIMSSGRRAGFAQAAQLGTTLTGLGMTADQLASADLEKIIDTLLTQQGFDVQKRGQNMQLYSSLGQAAGYAAGSAWGG